MIQVRDINTKEMKRNAVHYGEITVPVYQRTKAPNCWYDVAVKESSIIAGCREDDTSQFAGLIYKYAKELFAD